MNLGSYLYSYVFFRYLFYSMLSVSLAFTVGFELGWASSSLFWFGFCYASKARQLMFGLGEG